MRPVFKVGPPWLTATTRTNSGSVLASSYVGIAVGFTAVELVIPGNRVTHMQLQLWGRVSLMIIGYKLYLLVHHRLVVTGLLIFTRVQASRFEVGSQFRHVYFVDN